MIKKLYNFGKYIPESYFEENPLRIDRKHSEGKILFLCFDSIKDKYKYQRIEIEDYDKKKNESLYLFLELDSPNSSPYFPVYRVHKAGNKSFDDKINTAIEKINKSILTFAEIKTLNREIADNQKLILTDVKKISNENETFLLTIKINNEYLGQLTFIKQYKLEKIKNKYKDFYTYSKEEIIVTDKVCYLCNQKKENIWGYVSNFNFYAVKTEISVINSGFNFKDTWKNYPVCSECAVKMESYKDILTKYLSFYFYGFNYFLIPEIVFKNIDNKNINDKLLNEKYGLLNLKTISDTIELEDEMLDLLKDSNNFINYNLFFYKENNNEFKILLSIDNIFPSRFREIFDIKNKIRNYDIFKDLTGVYKNDEKDSLRFDFRIVQYFFNYKIYKDRNPIYESSFSKHFLEFIRSIFIGIKVDFNFVLSLIIKRIIIEFSNDLNFSYSVLRAIMLIKFITALKLWEKQNHIKEKEIIMNNEYESFFKEHIDFFDNITKKAIFLEGVLCQFLIDIQYRERKATPFKARLNGLKLDEQIIKRLLPEIINKLEEYDSNYYKDLEAIISEYLLDSKFSITNNEISFYFVMGMSLAKKFKSNKEEENINGNN